VGAAHVHHRRAPDLGRVPDFPRYLAHLIYNADDARVLGRYVQSRKIFHAALLLLILEATSAVPWGQVIPATRLLDQARADVSIHCEQEGTGTLGFFAGFI